MRTCFAACLILLAVPCALPQSPGAAMPPLPKFASSADLAITWQERLGSNHGETVRMFFQTKRNFDDGHTSNSVSRLFDEQLTAAGWHQTDAVTSNKVFASAWIRFGHEHLLFSILQLDAGRGYYFATFEVPQ